MVKCGQCDNQFENKSAFLVHKCEANEGATPTEPRFMGRHYERIQNAALDRGNQPES